MMTKSLNRTRLNELCKLIGLVDPVGLPNGGSDKRLTRDNMTNNMTGHETDNTI